MLFIYCAIQHARIESYSKLILLNIKNATKGSDTNCWKSMHFVEACEFNNELNIQFYPIKLTENKSYHI